MVIFDSLVLSFGHDKLEVRSAFVPQPRDFGAMNFEDEIQNVFKSAKIELCVIR